jgi:hypothetical protein
MSLARVVYTYSIPSMFVAVALFMINYRLAIEALPSRLFLLWICWLVLEIGGAVTRCGSRTMTSLLFHEIKVSFV